MIDFDDMLSAEMSARFKAEEARAKEPLPPNLEFDLSIAWSSACRDVTLLGGWLALLSPKLIGVLRVISGDRPDTVSAIHKRRLDVYLSFIAMLDELPGTKIDKFRRLGSPGILRFWAGLTPKGKTAREWEVEVWQRVNGKTPAADVGDSRTKQVIEPITGAIWPSATALAKDLGCRPITLYQHLGAAQKLKTVKGRVFEYIEPEAPARDPRLISNMTEAEKAALREQCIAAGFEPRF